MSRRAALWLWAGDALCLSLFVLAGLQTHDSASPLARFALNAGPLIGTWTIAALALGAFRPNASFRALLGRTLTAWLVAAPLALVVRAWLTGAATIVAIFMVITLGLGGLLLLLWRAAFIWILLKTSEVRARHE
jgi:hypothetical protein